MYPYPYIYRLVGLAPDLARAAFDVTVSDLVIPHLELQGPGVVPLLSGSYVPYRRCRGLLRSGFAPGLPVELELLPWSKSRTELGLTAMADRRPVLWPTSRRYLLVGGQALDALGVAMESWPDQLLGGLAAEWEEDVAVGGA